MEAPTVRLLLSCPDRRGLVAAVAQFILARDGNIIHAEQHTDSEAGTFFQRVEFALGKESVDRRQLAAALNELARPLDMRVQVRWSDEERRVAVLASRQAHCLYDLLARWHAGELPGTPALVISNHPDHAVVTESFGVPYHHLPVGPDPADKTAQEDRISTLLRQARVETVVLARYMQVLSASFVARWPASIINIHHSFLPAFVGGRPYHQAYERGVKLIGATAHYATADLDQGPIIEQDVTRVSHRHDIAAMVRAGRDLETVVLARAVGWHLTDRVLAYGNKTVVFS